MRDFTPEQEALFVNDPCRQDDIQDVLQQMEKVRTMAAHATAHGMVFDLADEIGKLDELYAEMTKHEDELADEIKRGEYAYPEFYERRYAPICEKCRSLCG